MRGVRAVVRAYRRVSAERASGRTRHPKGGTSRNSKVQVPASF